MKKALLVLGFIASLVFASPSPAIYAVVTVDGNNDFPPAALVDPDGGDTEFGPIDLGDIFIANDGTNLYIGYGHDHDGWGGVQVGIAIDCKPGGGNDDPWGRRIDFVGGFGPDFVAYTNIDSDWEDLVEWNNPNFGWNYNGGLNSLGWVQNTPFDEVAIPFSKINPGLECGQHILIEMWITQDNCNKGPLDLMFNDPLQLSTPGGTIWELPCDGSQDVQLGQAFLYTIACWPTASEASSWGTIKALFK
ncbi:MAG: hypothetical protein QME66_01150 [Candidatus Eisenbacteria bacterium]|nr:hypothetical protein [Candidatus Eisenbacteria bacterium]